MTTVLARTGAIVFSAVAMLSLLLGLAALALGRPDRMAVYLAVTVASSIVVGLVMRRDVRRRRAAEALLPPERRPARRAPRRAITFPILETCLTFVAWYLVAVGTDAVINGGTSVFTLSVIAPFASLMLTALTTAGRHMAFRLTAEEAGDEERGERGPGSAGRG